MEWKPTSKKFRHWVIIIVIAIIAIVSFFIYRSYIASATNLKTNPAIKVVTAAAQSTNVPYYIPALGTVTPTDSVTVRTQVNGQLMQVLFQEGQDVKAGDLLAQIDPRPYQAQLVQDQGQLARDQALLTNAQLDLKRYQQLWKEDSVSKQTLDTQAALVKQYQGTVILDQGLVENAKINLSYTKITSPIDGRVGLRLVDPGNFVQTSDTNGLAVINTIHPITVIFSIPEDDVTAVMQQINAGNILSVQAYDRNQSTLLSIGRLLTMDNQIDPTTGTVKLKAQFPNNENLLFPNQFVNIQLLVNTLNNVTVVPTAAIQNGAKGPFVFTVVANNTVKVTSVTTGIVWGQNTVITTGIKPGQQVVVEGGDKLTDGAAISATDPSLPIPPKLKTPSNNNPRSAT